MGFGDGICDSGVEDAIIKCAKDTDFFYSDFTSDFGSLDEWEFNLDELDKWEARLCYNGSLSFHSLLPFALTMMRSDVPYDALKNPFMMKDTKLRIREKLLTAMEERLGRKFERKKYVDFSDEQAADDYHQAEKRAKKKKEGKSAKKSTVKFVIE